MGYQQLGRDWRKSSFSNTNGACIEVASGTSMSAHWRKSSHSDTNGECVEVAGGASVSVRDTKDRAGAELAFTAAAWSAFTATLR
jgi:hypothetical protein